MRHEVYCPGRSFEEQCAAKEWQCRELQLQPVVTEDAKAKALIAFQNAMFAAAFCRRENGRCEGCGS